MDIRNHRQLKQDAHRSLAMASYDPRYLVMIHTGAALLLSLLVTALDFVLDNQIGNTGGLGGLGLRSVLSTIQSVLRIAEYIVLPFWQFGYIFTVLKLSRAEPAQPMSLLAGFRWFGPVLRVLLIQFLLYSAIAILVFYLSIQIFALSPLSEPLYQAVAPLMNETTLLTQDIVLDETVMTALSNAYVPIFIIFICIYALVCIPICYGLRMTNFCLMDAPEKGAFAAMKESRRMMRRNRFQLFRLDLSFWWYYLLHGVLVAVCYGDVLLPLIGIELPWSGTVNFFLFYILSMIFQMILYTLVKNEVEVTYALAYESLRQPPPEKALWPTPYDQPNN